MRKSNQPLVRKALQEHQDGLTINQLAEITGGLKHSILAALKCMPDAYIDRWTTIGDRKQRYWQGVWCVVAVPENCPKPDKVKK